ncbi:MAG: hypothetical protein IKS20_02315 [Victivallales bacterium]|nr:hypothetical protein [Victivallales bacterium]
MNKVKFAILAAAMIGVAGCSNITFALRSVIHQTNYDGGEKGRITAKPSDSGSNKVEAPKETTLTDSGKLSLTGK